jgi:hypothetical protein
MELFLNYFSEEFRMNLKFKKSTEEFVCLGCHFSTSRSNLYDRHLLTAKHKRMLEGCEKGQKRYECKICDFISSHSKNYEEHLATAKHLKMLEDLKKTTESSLKKNTEEEDVPKICGCGKEYKYKKAFLTHRKSCLCIDNLDATKDTLENVLTPANMMELVISIVKSNSDIKELMVEQMKHHMETEKRQLEHHLETEKRLLELVKEPRNSINTSNNHSNNNNSFNLNFFLNETCKDAINVSEFIENIKIEFSDVENVGKKGYVTGITDMIVRNLADLGTTKRPFHCTDTKRETIYIKDNNKWDKDTETKENFQKVLNQIYNKNWNTLRSWAQANPEIRTLDSRENILYHKILEQTDCIKGLDRLPDTNDKIIRKLSENIKIERSSNTI